MQFDPRDATRATLAAMLQSGWGIAPTYVAARARACLLPARYPSHAVTHARTHARRRHSWNYWLNDTETDYTWSIGDTPFDYFSTSTRLAFPHRDAA